MTTGSKTSDSENMEDSNVNYLIAGAILLVWIYIALSFSWDPNTRTGINLFLGFSVVILLGLIYWIPFWLIFVK